jgi:hypothetical protein
VHLRDAHCNASTDASASRRLGVRPQGYGPQGYEDTENIEHVLDLQVLAMLLVPVMHLLDIHKYTLTEIRVVDERAVELPSALQHEQLVRAGTVNFGA